MTWLENLFFLILTKTKTASYRYNQLLSTVIIIVDFLHMQFKGIVMSFHQKNQTKIYFVIAIYQA